LSNFFDIRDVTKKKPDCIDHPFGLNPSGKPIVHGTK